MTIADLGWELNRAGREFAQKILPTLAKKMRDKAREEAQLRHLITATHTVLNTTRLIIENGESCRQRLTEAALPLMESIVRQVAESSEIAIHDKVQNEVLISRNFVPIYFPDRYPWLQSDIADAAATNIDRMRTRITLQRAPVST